jgi:hypothetical protein
MRAAYESMSCHPCILQTLLGQVDKGMPSLRIFILCNVHVAISHGICPRVKEGALYFAPNCVFGKDKGTVCFCVLKALLTKFEIFLFFY